MSELIDVVTLQAILGSVLFGLLIGMTYGWRASPAAAQSDVLVLFSVVLGFLVMRGFFNLFADSPTSAARTVGNAILWLVVCLAILRGRGLRRRFEAWRARRKIAELTLQGPGS